MVITVYDYYMVNDMMVNNNLVGGFNPSEKYESQLGLLFPIHGKIYKKTNHQHPPTRYRIIKRKNTNAVGYDGLCRAHVGIKMYG